LLRAKEIDVKFALGERNLPKDPVMIDAIESILTKLA
jgi:hypothetical protein